MTLIHGIESTMEANLAQILWTESLRSSFPRDGDIHAPHELRMSHQAPRATECQWHRVQAMHPAQSSLCFRCEASSYFL